MSQLNPPTKFLLSTSPGHVGCVKFPTEQGLVHPGYDMNMTCIGIIQSHHDCHAYWQSSSSHYSLLTLLGSNVLLHLKAMKVQYIVYPHTMCVITHVPTHHSLLNGILTKATVHLLWVERQFDFFVMLLGWLQLQNCTWDQWTNAEELLQAW